MQSQRWGLAPTLAFCLAAASPALAQGVAPHAGHLGPAEIHGPGNVPDIPQTPREIVRERQLPGHGMPELPFGADNGIPQPNTPPTVPATAAPPGAPCTIRYFVNRVVEPSGAALSTVGEPTAACNRDTGFMTGNWYAGLSRDAGMSWEHVNPFAKFPAIDGGFCCDQRSIYVPYRDLTIWYLQYVYSATTQKGSVRIAVAPSRDRLRDNSWHSWVFNPQSFGLPAGLWLDFPSVAYSDSHLYCTSNVFDASGGYQDSVVWKMTLTDLDIGNGLSYWFWTRYSTAAIGATGWYRLVQGATTTMYLASHNTFANMRVFRNADFPSNAPMQWNDRNVADWSNGSFVATSPGGTNWAGRAQSHVQTGYVKNGEYGFLWSVGRRPANNRPQCYIRVARFSTANNTLIGQEDIWNGASLALLYPACAPNSSGEIGVTWAFGQGDGAAGWHPTTGVRIVDNTCQTTFGGGTFAVPFSGNVSPTRNAWGDYFSVQRHPNHTRTFVGSGMTQRDSPSNQGQEPHYLWFGFESDEPNWVTLFVQATIGAQPPVITIEETDLDGLEGGVTPFSRRFMPNQRYTLTAPATWMSGGETYVFCNWHYRLQPGSPWIEMPAGELILAIDSMGTVGDVAEAVYAREVTISVDDRNVGGNVPIAVESIDLDGNQDGSTPFTRRYKDEGLQRRFLAPPFVGNQPFRRWYVNGVAQPTGQLVVALDGRFNTALEVEYCSHLDGVYKQYGQGCTGSNGRVPVHASTSNPEIGTTVTHTVAGLIGKTPAAMFLGFSNTTWNGLGLPLSLGFVGANPACNVLAEGFLVLPVTIDAAGNGSRSFQVTYDPALIGTHVYTQVIAADPFLRDPVPLVVSNGLDMLVGGSHLRGARCP